MQEGNGQMHEPITIVKLGGSAITDKEIPFSFRDAVVVRLSKAMAESHARIILVHGGGSFAHPLARQLGATSSRLNVPPAGISELKNSMNSLNSKVCRSLIKGGLSPFTFSPYKFVLDAGDAGRRWLEGMVSTGFVPITYADVEKNDSGFQIISSDMVSFKLSRFVRTKRCIIVLDSDGILDRKGNRMDEIRGNPSIQFSKTDSDVTGGIKEKIRIARLMAAEGISVSFISGFRPVELTRALEGQEHLGTVMKAL